MGSFTVMSAIRTPLDAIARSSGSTDSIAARPASWLAAATMFIVLSTSWISIWIVPSWSGFNVTDSRDGEVPLCARTASINVLASWSGRNVR